VIGTTLVWKDQKLYYIFEVKSGNKKEKFATDLPQDAENWCKAIELLMPKANVRASTTNGAPSDTAKISLSAAEWIAKGKPMLNLLNGEEVCLFFCEIVVVGGLDSLVNVCIWLTLLLFVLVIDR
jgi:putative IMPACT (imprinted ancient) family translation regulator